MKLKEGGMTRCGLSESLNVRGQQYSLLRVNAAFLRCADMIRFGKYEDTRTEKTDKDLRKRLFLFKFSVNRSR